MAPSLCPCRALRGWSTCRWTRARTGTWHSCPLLVTSSFIPSCQLTRTWSSCTWTSPKVGPCNKQQPEQVPHPTCTQTTSCLTFRTNLICVCFVLRRHRIRHHLRVRRSRHRVLKVAGAPPLHQHRGDGLHQCHVPEGSFHHQRPGRGWISIHAEETAALIFFVVGTLVGKKCLWTPRAILMHCVSLMYQMLVQSLTFSHEVHMHVQLSNLLFTLHWRSQNLLILTSKKSHFKYILTVFGIEYNFDVEYKRIYYCMTSLLDTAGGRAGHK